MGNSTEASERVVQMMQEVVSRNEEMYDEQKRFFGELIAQQNEMLKSLKSENNK